MKDTLPGHSVHMPDIHSILKKYFGFDSFREGQEAVVSALLEGKSAAAVFPTGGGKSLCYQLPALWFDGLTLVVSPLIALMKDQIDALEKRGIRAARLDSSLSQDEYRQVMDDIRCGELKLLYVAPERFNNERFRMSLEPIEISLFAIDEAHCISEWGHNFRPDYLKLVEFSRNCGAKRLLALTATATQEVLHDICSQFRIEPECAVNTGFYRDNLTLRTTAVSADTRDLTLKSLFRNMQPGPSIVYVTLQKTAEVVAQLLRDDGFNARHYHAGLKNNEREEVQDWFIQSDNNIVVATIAFGMGIDKSNIRAVYHYNLPKSLENYSQEIGRAGRDGLPSVCHLLACADDMVPLENFVYGDTPTHKALERFVEQVFPTDEEFDISLYELSNTCDIRPLVLKTMLTRLELLGYLKGGTPFYSNYQFKPLMSSKEILSGFDEERRNFIAAIFKCASKGRIWFSVDLEATATKISSPRDRLIRALDYLAEQRMLEVKVAGLRHRYLIVQRPECLNKLAQQLFDEVKNREARELRRLQQMHDWVVLDQCQTASLVERFEGAPAQDCGHCSWCETKTSVVLDARRTDVISQRLIDQSLELRRNYSEVLPSATELTRVLCGLSSPAINKARLQKEPLFGICELIPYRSVLDTVIREMQSTKGRD